MIRGPQRIDQSDALGKTRPACGIAAAAGRDGPRSYDSGSGHTSHGVENCSIFDENQLTAVAPRCKYTVNTVYGRYIYN